MNKLRAYHSLLPLEMIIGAPAHREPNTSRAESVADCIVTDVLASLNHDPVDPLEIEAIVKNPFLTDKQRIEIAHALQARVAMEMTDDDQKRVKPIVQRMMMNLRSREENSFSNGEFGRWVGLNIRRILRTTTKDMKDCMREIGVLLDKPMGSVPLINICRELMTLGDMPSGENSDIWEIRDDVRHLLISRLVDRLEKLNQSPDRS